jgi:hypothetical protein
MFIALLLLFPIAALSQTKKSYAWEQGACKKISVSRDYRCEIFVWGKQDDGKDALLVLVEMVSGGNFFINLNQFFMKDDLAVNGGNLKSEFIFTVDDRIPLKFTASNTVVEPHPQHPMYTLIVPITENLFTYLERGKNIKATYEKSDGTKGNATFSLDGYIEKLVIMTSRTQQFKK